MNKLRPRKPRGAVLGKTRQRMLFDRLHKGGGAPIPPPNNTVFASATTATNHSLTITLSDDKGYASVHTEWEVKVGGVKVAPALHVSGHDTNSFIIFVADDPHAPTPVFHAGDVITVSHLVADSGIVKFTDKPVTNSLT